MQEKAQDVALLTRRVAELEQRDARRGCILDDMLSRTASVYANRSPSPSAPHRTPPTPGANHRPLSADASPEFMSSSFDGSPLLAWQAEGGAPGPARSPRRTSSSVAVRRCLHWGWEGCWNERGKFERGERECWRKSWSE